MVKSYLSRGDGESRFRRPFQECRVVCAVPGRYNTPLLVGKRLWRAIRKGPPPVTTNDSGYVNYFDVLGLDESAKPGEVRKSYRRKMKDLVNEIATVEITEESRSRYLLEMAKLNAALYVLRETESRDEYWQMRQDLIALEAEWAAAADMRDENGDRLRKTYDGMLREFLSKYVEDLMLAAGRDKECVEASHWDPAHERHAFRILRHYRQSLYRQILERLPYAEVTRPVIDWSERRQEVSRMLRHGGF